VIAPSVPDALMDCMVYALAVRKFRLPVEDSVQCPLAVYVPADQAWLRPERVRELTEEWLGAHADEPARKFLGRFLARGWGTFVFVEIEPTDSPAWQPGPSADVPCWMNATEGQRHAVTSAARIVSISCGDVPGRRPLGALTALAIAYATQEASGGAVYDPAAARFLAPLQRPLTLDVEVSDHITFVSSFDAQRIGTMSTRGMIKFGVKGVLWSGYPAEREREILQVANAVARHLVWLVEEQCTEAGDPPREIEVEEELELTLADVVVGGRGDPAAQGTTRLGLRREGNRCEVVPPSSFHGSPAEWAERVLADLTRTVTLH
jgi:hypothetical protein